MRIFLPGFALILSACSAPRIETVTVVPEVGADLRAPCRVVPREYASLKDVALILADHVAALDCANGKIIAIDAILTDAEAQ